MKKIIFIMLAIILSIGIASAQNGKFVFGPLEDDSAAVMTVENNTALTLPVWIRTEPGIKIVGIHWPVASNNSYIASRDGINYDFLPFVAQSEGDSSWQSMTVLAPNPFGDDFTNQGVLGIKDFPRTPYADDGIATEGEWWLVAEYFMTTTGSNPVDTLLTDVLMVGSQQDNGGFVWAEFSQGELPWDSFDYSFSSMVFANNIDPVWCQTELEICGDIGATLCISLCGTDDNLNDDLRITQISGGGEYVEESGGPGGYTSGTWCGSLPTGTHALVFELDDNFGGVVPLEITVVMREVNLRIGCVSGFPGGTVSIPVSLSTCDFKMGSMDLLIGWESSMVSLVRVTPTSRIDDGSEYWNVNTQSPCDECPELDGARIVWTADINNGIPNPPAYAGDDPIIFMTFVLSEDLELDDVVPISFYNQVYSSNTISDSAGFNWFRPELTDGCVEIVDPDDYKGDPNMNGLFYEVGDAMVVVRYLIFGSVIWWENGTTDDAIQESSADLNNNNMVDVPDLIRFINIINGRNEPPKLDPTPGAATICAKTGEEAFDIVITSNIEVGGVLLTLNHPGIEFGDPLSETMEVVSRDDDDLTKVLVYSMEGNTIAPGNSTLLSIPVVSNNGGSVEIIDVSAADAYGRFLETSVSVYTPLPREYTVFANYPNPFNAQTLISFALPEASRVIVEIYDPLGRSVATLVDGLMQAGYQSVVWDAAGQSSGIYFYKVQAGEFVESKKMMLIK
ncbi:MAG: T9SS type A sorting domain-containing protein [candidate division Zixibacteria bacterium]